MSTATGSGRRGDPAAGAGAGHTHGSAGAGHRQPHVRRSGPRCLEVTPHGSPPPAPKPARGDRRLVLSVAAEAGCPRGGGLGPAACRCRRRLRTGRLCWAGGRPAGTARALRLRFLDVSALAGPGPPPRGPLAFPENVLHEQPRGQADPTLRSGPVGSGPLPGWFLSRAACSPAPRTQPRPQAPPRTQPRPGEPAEGGRRSRSHADRPQSPVPAEVKTTWWRWSGRARLCPVPGVRGGRRHWAVQTTENAGLPFRDTGAGTQRAGGRGQDAADRMCPPHGFLPPGPTGKPASSP